jgi:hypothetical protein
MSKSNDRSPPTATFVLQLIHGLPPDEAKALFGDLECLDSPARAAGFTVIPTEVWEALAGDVPGEVGGFFREAFDLLIDLGNKINCPDRAVREETEEAMRRHEDGMKWAACAARLNVTVETLLQRVRRHKKRRQAE